MSLWENGVSYATLMAFLAVVGIVTGISPVVSAASGVRFVQTEKQRVIVLTDISNESDDEQSLVRFLVYSNEYDVEGLIATTSVWLRDKVRPDKIRERVEAYGRVRNNLLKHASGHPDEKKLRDLIKAGLPEFGMEGVGEAAGRSYTALSRTICLIMFG